MAYVANGRGLQLICLSDLLQACLVGSLTAPGVTTGIDTGGSYTQMPDYVAGLPILDVSDPVGDFGARPDDRAKC